MGGLALALGCVGGAGLSIGLTVALWFYLDYNTISNAKKRVVMGVIIVSILLIIGGIFVGANKSCYDYTTLDYQTGDVPVSCRNVVSIPSDAGN